MSSEQTSLRREWVPAQLLSVLLTPSRNTASLVARKLFPMNETFMVVVLSIGMLRWLVRSECRFVNRNP